MNIWAVFVFGLASLFPLHAQNATIGSDFKEGPQISSYQTVAKEYFPAASKVREQKFVPFTSGGTSFMGLVSRLLGERPDPTFEGIKTKRYLYHVYEGRKPVGIAHASSFAYNSNKVDVLIVYKSDGSIKNLVATGLPEHIAKEFESGNYLKQFEGHFTEDFEIVRGRKGRIRSRGDFFSSHKKPVGALARGYFDKILRSVRFNAAFMDVAYFITKHPDLDNESEKIIAEAQADGPEAFVKNRKTGESLRSPATADSSTAQ